MSGVRASLAQVSCCADFNKKLESQSINHLQENIVIVNNIINGSLGSIMCSSLDNAIFYYKSTAQIHLLNFTSSRLVANQLAL